LFKRNLLKYITLDFSYIYYCSLVITAALLSGFLTIKGSSQFLYLMMLMVATLLTEIATRIIPSSRMSLFFLTLDIFNVIEYTLFCLYYLKTSRNDKVKLFVKVSIPLFIVFAVYVSVFVNHFAKFPVLNIDVEGFLLFIIYTHLLFNLEVDENRFIYSLANFWISIGVLIFYGGAFGFFGLYPILHHLDQYKTFNEYNFILQPLNMVLYNCIIIGLICQIRTRKYSIR
jgi:hypothetical protein